MKYRVQERLGNAAEWKPTDMLWADPKRAAKIVDTYNAKQREEGTQRRYRVVPEADDDYRAREAERMAGKSGVLPTSWMKGVIPLLPDYHYPRLIKPGVIGYFDNQRDCEINRLNELSASRYLNTFIHHVIQDPLTLAEEAGEIVERVKVIFTDVQEEITKVYLNAGRIGSPCGSCATKPACDYLSHPVHPSVIYGKPGDTALLYTLADGIQSINDPNARVTGRCLIYPEKKVHVMAYGYPQDTGHIRQWLKVNGYNHGVGGAWHGCRLNYVEVKKSVVTAQCDFSGYFRVNLENGQPVARVATPKDKAYCYDCPAGSFPCYSGSGLAGPVREWKEI